MVTHSIFISIPPQVFVLIEYIFMFDNSSWSLYSILYNENVYMWARIYFKIFPVTIMSKSFESIFWIIVKITIVSQLIKTT